MGMVKRVLYTATGGSCRDPEAVSWSRNDSGSFYRAHLPLGDLGIYDFAFLKTTIAQDAISCGCLR